MRESPTIEISWVETDEDVRQKLAYAASLLRGTLPVWPEAVLMLTGSVNAASRLRDRLVTQHGLSSRQVAINSINDPFDNGRTLTLSIVYFPKKAGTRSVWVEFKPDIL